MTTTTYLDHTVTISKRKKGYAIKIIMPNNTGHVKADAEVTTLTQAQRVAVRIIEHLTNRVAAATGEANAN